MNQALLCSNAVLPYEEDERNLSLPLCLPVQTTRRRNGVAGMDQVQEDHG